MVALATHRKLQAPFSTCLFSTPVLQAITNDTEDHDVSMCEENVRNWGHTSQSQVEAAGYPQRRKVVWREHPADSNHLVI